MQTTTRTSLLTDRDAMAGYILEAWTRTHGADVFGLTSVELLPLLESCTTHELQVACRDIALALVEAELE